MESLLYVFTGPPNGYGPGLGDVTFDEAGNIYGTTYSGGNGYGIAYEVTTSGGGWTENMGRCTLLTQTCSRRLYPHDTQLSLSIK
jgi:hypothetical protein